MTASSIDDHDLHEHLQSLEAKLLKNPTRTSRKRLLELLSPEFVEFGSSGRTFDQESMIASLVQWDGVSVHTVCDFKLIRLAEDAALVTYRLETPFPDEDKIVESLRSFLWVRAADGWVVRFHQGTRKP
ncbi:MAG: hypothetical protein ACI8TQ_003078 [Planctomycetota bacterium]|jgi:hypothetical protein